MWQYFDREKPLHKSWVYPNVGVVTRNDLEVAKYVLTQFSVVLIVEKLQQQLPLLSYYFGVSTNDMRPRTWTGKIDTNYAPKNYSKIINQTEYQHLMKLNALDVELYEFAVELSRCNVFMVFFDQCSITTTTTSR
jgi:hypothetical protein